jgi:hypothetical protein
MFIVHRIDLRNKLRQERHISDEQHVAPDGAWLSLACAGYKHQAPTEPGHSLPLTDVKRNAEEGMMNVKT